MPIAGPNDRQLPVGDEIFLDHVGHFVRDIEAASRAFERAGFAPTPVSIQSNPDPAGGQPKLTGTGNVTVMFQRGYIEALFKTADTPLGRQLDAGLARHGGVHLIAFSVADAAAAHRRLAEQEFRVQPLVEMQRPVDTGGAPGTAAFTLARVEPGEMPEGRIQILTHHTEQMVWQPRWLEHPNGAFGLTGVWIAVDYAPDAARRFARFTGRRAEPETYGQVIKLDRGGFGLVNPKSFALIFPDVPAPSLPFIGVYGIKVKSLAMTEDLVRRGGLQARRTEHTLYVVWPEELGHGVWMFGE
jgi:glyoxalase-like protein